MPRMARDYNYQNDYRYQSLYPHAVAPVKFGTITTKSHNRRRIQRKKVNPIARLISLALLCLLGIFVLPFGFNSVSKQIIFGAPYKNVQVDVQDTMNPTLKYFSNDMFLN